MKYTLLVLLVLPVVSANIIITEIHPHPPAQESYNEWIEIFNNGTQDIDVFNWTIGDVKDRDFVQGALFEGGTTLRPEQYALITDDATRVYDNYEVDPLALHLYVDDASIGNGLSNRGEFIFLSFMDYIHNVSFDSVDKGMSASLVNGSFVQTLPTPGYDNSGNLETYCDYGVDIIMNDTVFSSPDDFWWKMRAVKHNGPSTLLEGDAHILDFYGNVIKEYMPWKNQSISTQRTSSTYSPNLQSGQSYILRVNISTHCKDLNLENNAQEIVFSLLDSQELDSSLAISSIYDLGSDKKARFGQTIRTKIHAYRGETSKSTVTAWVGGFGKRVSKQSKFSIDDEFSITSVTIPIQLEPNCEEKFSHGEYDLIVEGLDHFDSRSFMIEGYTEDLCEVVEVEKKASGKVDFVVRTIPSFFHGKESTISLSILNEKNEHLLVDVWSYMYRGGKSYSGQRMSNKQTHTIEGKSSKELVLVNTPHIEEEGEYKLKVLMQQSHRKTPDEKTFDIFVSKEQEETQPVKTFQHHTNEHTKNEQIIAKPVPVPETIYLSSSEKATQLAPLFLILMLVLLCVALVWV